MPKEGNGRQLAVDQALMANLHEVLNGPRKYRVKETGKYREIDCDGTSHVYRGPKLPVDGPTHAIKKRFEGLHAVRRLPMTGIKLRKRWAIAPTILLTGG
jgi:hypothetical protein